MESTQTSSVVKSGHFQISNWLKACHPHALTQLSPNLEEYAAEAEWTARVLSAVNAQLMECASHGSFQPAPGPFPASTQLPRTAACSWPSCWKQPQTQHTASHQPALQGQKANRSLPSICAIPTSPSTSLCRPQLKYILKTHSKAKHLKCKPSLHHLDLVPFPQRFTHLSLSIHRPEPATSTQKVDFSTLSSPVWLLPDQLSFRIHSGFCKIS